MEWAKVLPEINTNVNTEGAVVVNSDPEKLVCPLLDGHVLTIILTRKGYVREEAYEPDLLGQRHRRALQRDPALATIQHLANRQADVKFRGAAPKL